MSEGYTMSDKAKGKRRAYPIHIPNGRPDETPKQSMIPVIIRFADGSPDLALELPSDMTANSVADVIRKSRPQFEEKQIKLIHAGKMLFEYTPLSSLRTSQSPTSPQSPERFQRISMSDRNVYDKGKRRESAQQPPPIWLHCSMSDPKSEDPDSSPDQVADQTSAYDRFTDAGLSRNDVDGLRTAFRRLLYGNGRGNNGPTNYALPPAQINQLETNWVETISQPSTYEEATASPDPDSLLSRILPSTTYSSSIRNLTQGLILGFFFPFMAGTIFHVTERPPAFYDGDVWTGLDHSLNRISASLDATTSAGSEGADISTGGRRRARPTNGTRDQTGTVWASDVIMDPVLALPLSIDAWRAILAGMVLNIVVGFYLWSYTS